MYLMIMTFPQLYNLASQLPILELTVNSHEDPARKSRAKLAVGNHNHIVQGLGRYYSIEVAEDLSGLLPPSPVPAGNLDRPVLAPG